MTRHRSARLQRRATAAVALAALAVAVPDAMAAAPYTATPAPYVANPEFTVTYDGAANWRTVFHATPPNPGGRRDTNDANDWSTQSWRLTFRSRLAIPTCGAPADGSADPCAALGTLSGATGATAATGRVRHTHVDGLYRSLNRRVQCTVSRGTRPRSRVAATLGLRYAADSKSIGITAGNPVGTVLTLLPSACPRQGDSIDRVLDNYFTPGFSFAPDYGPDRWLTSREVAIPDDVLRRSSRISIRMAQTRPNVPPRNCAVRDPAFERCRTGGTWAGVLTLRRLATRARAAATPVRAPRSGRWTGYAGGRRLMTVYVAGKSISLVAFQFACGSTTGSTSLGDIKLRRTSQGYRFAISAHGIASFRDNRVDQNAKIDVSGRFSPLAKSLTGIVRVRVPSCRDTGYVRWSARPR